MSIYACIDHPCTPACCCQFSRCRKDMKQRRRDFDADRASTPAGYSCRIHPDVTMIPGVSFSCYKCEAGMRDYKDLF